MAYLRILWDEEHRKMLSELHADRSKQGKLFLKELNSIDGRLVDATLEMYLGRCKVKYTLAFL